MCPSTPFEQIKVFVYLKVCSGLKSHLMMYSNIHLLTQFRLVLKVASYSFLTAHNLVTKKWLMARPFKSSRDSARSTRGSPTQEVNKHGFPTLQTLFSSKTCELINFSKCLPTCKKVADSLESKRRFKKIISRCFEQLMSL